MRILILAISLLFFTLPAFAGDDWRPSFEGGRMSEALWGMAQGSVGGDPAADTVLLARREVLVGQLGSKGFKRTASCEIPGTAAGARVYLFDLDGDGAREIIVSAVEDGMPASLAFAFADGKCRTIFTRARWSLRVIRDENGNEKFIGQGWSSDSFFSGPVVGLKFENGKLKAEGKMNLPRYVNIFQFVQIPGAADPEFAVVKGYDHLQVYEKRERGFGRIWKSGEKFGGSLNLLAASQREVMGEVTSDRVEFDTPPLVSLGDGGMLLIAVRHDMPIASFVGKRPLIRGSEVIVFAPDPSFVFDEILKTMRMPGVVTDAIVEPREGGGARLYVLMQDLQGMFMDARKSFVIGFDLPTGAK